MPTTLVTERTLDVIAVTLNSGERVPVAPKAVMGAYAVHEQVLDGLVCGPYWSVTHRASGAMVWTAFTYAAALKVAMWWVNKSGAPATEREFWSWWHAVRANDQKYAELVKACHAAAPRPDALGAILTEELQ